MSWTTWEIALYALGGVLAVGSLVRLMLARRNQLVAEVEAQLAAARRGKDH